MRSSLALGLRLARGSHGARAAAVVLTSAIGVWVILASLAVVHAQVLRPEYAHDGGELLVLAVAATVTVPVVILVATVARLSAALRDRRLVNLRTLGLSAARTRLVAAVEAGAGAVVGSVLGLVAHLATRSYLPTFGTADLQMSTVDRTVWTVAAALAVVGVPIVAMLVAIIPAGRESTPTATQARAWRALPLLIGLGLAFLGAATAMYPVLIVGGAIAGLGLAVLVPVFTALVADLMVRIPGRPSLRIAGRRLQVQPAGVTRVVAGLLLGLFVVAGGRMVVGAWESTPQYRAADRALHEGPAAYSVALESSDGVDDLAARLGSIPGVRGAYVVRQVFTGCEEGSAVCSTAFVGTCADLAAAVPDVRGCRDDRVGWLDQPDSTITGSTIAWRAGDSRAPADPVDTPTPSPDDVITSPSSQFGTSDALQAQVFVPSTTPGMLALADADRENTLASVSVQVDPGLLSAADVQSAAEAVSPGASSFSQFDDSEYRFVQGLRTLVLLIASLVLAIGMLGFLVAVADRSIARRAEVVSLQLVGTPRSVIRASQWWEAAVPLVIGVVLAVSSGAAVGAAYLVYGGDSNPTRPWGFIVGLTGVGLVSAVFVAATTVVASSPRIRADLMRRA